MEPKQVGHVTIVSANFYVLRGPPQDSASQRECNISNIGCVMVGPSRNSIEVLLDLI